MSVYLSLLLSYAFVKFTTVRLDDEFPSLAKDAIAYLRYSNFLDLSAAAVIWAIANLTYKRSAHWSSFIPCAHQ